LSAFAAENRGLTAVVKTLYRMNMSVICLCQCPLHLRTLL